MEKSTFHSGRADSNDPAIFEKVVKNEWYSDCFVIYLDKMGTSDQIRERDDVYDNRKGLYQLGIVYKKSLEIFHDLFSDSFRFFGFSDTVMAVIPYDENNPVSTDLIAKTAISLFIELTKMNFPVQIFISRGDFGFNTFEGIIDKSIGAVCPVYGSSLLYATEFDKHWKMVDSNCVGVFIDNSAITDFKIIYRIKVDDGKKEIGIIDFEHYLMPEEFVWFKEVIGNHPEVKTLDVLQKKMFDKKYGC